MTCIDTTTLIAATNDELSSSEKQELEAHCLKCVGCRDSYTHLQKLAETIPGAMGVPENSDFTEKVLENLAPRPSKGFARWSVYIAAPAAVALSLAVFLFWPQDESTQFQARGAHDQQVYCDHYIHNKSDPHSRRLLQSGESIQLGDGFSFVCHKADTKKWHYGLLGIDAAGAIHWFYPAFLDARHPPKLAEFSGSSMNLPEGVTPEQPAVGPFTLVNLFVDHPMSVTDIERRIESGGVPSLRQIEHTIVHSKTISVRAPK